MAGSVNEMRDDGGLGEFSDAHHRAALLTDAGLLGEQRRHVGIRPHAEKKDVEAGKDARLLGPVIGGISRVLGLSCRLEFFRIGSSSFVRGAELIRGSGFVNTRRIHRQMSQQSLVCLAGVPVIAVSGNKTLVTPPEVNPRPIHCRRRGRVSHSLQGSDTNGSAGEDHRRFTVLVLDIHELGDEACRNGRHQHLGVGVDAYSWLSVHLSGLSSGW